MATEKGDGDKELPDEDEGTVDRPEFKGTNVIKDTVLKVEAVNGDVESGDVGTSQAKGSQSQQLEQSQGAGVAICWQRFLHLTSIKVLLVENDDSTRHILSALLRNCNYEVIEVVNGLQAWTILENLDNHIDLVLTEVVMPCLSGTSLLCKIMSHKTRKTIPVIMMSSHDSVGLVFKCLSKGAADFLLKPIRKNELKNLWQHVWRRCHSSSGSGSESGTQTQKSVKSKSSEQSGNNSGSNDEEDNQRNGPPGNGSDDGSGTQSSWTKQAVEVDSSRAVPPCDRVPVHGDSTCAQVNAETAAHMRAHLKPSRQCQVEEPDNAGIDKPSTTGSVRDPELKPENASEVPLKHLSTRGKSALQIDSNASSLKALSNFLPSEHHVVTAVMSCPEIDSRELNRVVDSLEIDNTSTNDSKHHVVELCLKRQRGPGPLGESGITSQDDRNVLRRSELSAFSRYNSGGNHIRTPNGITQGSYLVENSLEIAKTKPVHVIDTHMNEILLNQRSNRVSNNNAAGCSNTNILISKSLPLSDTNANSDTGLARTGRGGGEATGSGSRNTMDPFKLVREAALTKFRQKRKERCFLKKVRYQNRKRQAEQRPRVRGHFVRHREQNNPNNATEG